MRLQESAENYLETILILKKDKGDLRSIDIAHRLGYSKPSVSVAMKNLKEKQLITIDDSGLINLTDSGIKIAETIYERHVLISQWFITLGVSQKQALEDACLIEHVISEESFEALKKHVNKRKLFNK